MATVRRRTARPVEPEEDDVDEELDDVDDLEDEEDDEETPPVTRRRDRVKSKDVDATRSRRAPVEDDDEDEDVEADDDEEEDEEPAPRKRTAPRKAVPVATKARRRSGPPPGIGIGLAGAEEVRRTSSSGTPYIKPEEQPQLFKIIEKEPSFTFSRHWVPMEGSRGDRPVVCVGKGCPLCAMGNRTSVVTFFNVLQFTGSAEPSHTSLQLSPMAFDALVAVAKDRRTGIPVFEKDYFTVQISAKKRSNNGPPTPPVFRRLKLRDVEEDWPEIFEHFDKEDIPAIVREARGELYDWNVLEIPTAKKLKEIARYLTEDDSEED